MPKKGVETLVKEFISDLLTKFKNLREPLTEKFVVEDVWECILDFQKKVNEDAGSPTFVDSRISDFLFNVSTKKRGIINFEKVKDILKDEKSLKGLENVKYDGYSMGSLFNEILDGVEKAKKSDDDFEITSPSGSNQNVKETKKEDDDFKILTFNKEQSKKINEAIKNFKNNSSGLKDTLTPLEYLQSIWYHLIICCNKIEENKDGISDQAPNNDKGLVGFYFRVKELNGGNLDKSKNILIEKKDKVKNIVKFLRNIKNLKGTGNKIDDPKIDILINQCNEALKIYSTKKNLENRKTKKSGDIIKSVKSDLKEAFTKINNNNVDEFYKSIKSAFEGLCDLAEMEGKNSSSSKKGLAGWYNEYKNSESNGEVWNAISGIGKYIKGTGIIRVLRFGKTRLDGIWKIIEKSQKEVGDKIESEAKK